MNTIQPRYSVWPSKNRNHYEWCPNKPQTTEAFSNLPRPRLVCVWSRNHDWGVDFVVRSSRCKRTKPASAHVYVAVEDWGFSFCYSFRPFILSVIQRMFDPVTAALRAGAKRKSLISHSSVSRHRGWLTWEHTHLTIPVSFRVTLTSASPTMNSWNWNTWTIGDSVGFQA